MKTSHAVGSAGLPSLVGCVVTRSEFAKVATRSRTLGPSSGGGGCRVELTRALESVTHQLIGSALISSHDRRVIRAEMMADSADLKGKPAGRASTRDGFGTRCYE